MKRASLFLKTGNLLLAQLLPMCDSYRLPHLSPTKRLSLRRWVQRKQIVLVLQSILHRLRYLSPSATSGNMSLPSGPVFYHNTLFQLQSNKHWVCCSRGREWAANVQVPHTKGEGKGRDSWKCWGFKRIVKEKASNCFTSQNKQRSWPWKKAN